MPDGKDCLEAGSPGGNKRKEDAMETIAHLLLIMGYSLLILRHFLGL
jgi:hypothetical protein